MVLLLTTVSQDHDILLVVTPCCLFSLSLSLSFGWRVTVVAAARQLEEQNQHLREQNQKCNEQLELLRNRLRQLSQTNSANSKNHRASTEV